MHKCLNNYMFKDKNYPDLTGTGLVLSVINYKPLLISLSKSNLTYCYMYLEPGKMIIGKQCRSGSTKSVNRIFHKKSNKIDQTPQKWQWTRPTYNSGRFHKYVMDKRQHLVTSPIYLFYVWWALLNLKSGLIYFLPFFYHFHFFRKCPFKICN